MEIVAHAAPDGYTIPASGYIANLGIGPGLYANLRSSDPRLMRNPQLDHRQTSLPCTRLCR